MGTKFEYVQHFPAPATQVLAMLHDVDYVRARCDETGSLKTSAEVTGSAADGCTVTSTRILPADVPAAAKSFVGDTIKVTETQTWKPAGADGSCSAALSVDFGGPMSFTGAIELSPDGESTTVRTSGEFKASIPFIGGKMEKVAAEQTERYLRTEQSVGTAWLSR